MKVGTHAVTLLTHRNIRNNLISSYAQQINYDRTGQTIDELRNPLLHRLYVTRISADVGVICAAYRRHNANR